jgi:cell shape-determining protein MreC
MSRIYQRRTTDFYTFIILIILSILTLILDHKYNQISQIRSFINDLIVYPISKISNLPKSIIDEAIRESSNIDTLELEISNLKLKL